VLLCEACAHTSFVLWWKHLSTSATSNGCYISLIPQAETSDNNSNLGEDVRQFSVVRTSTTFPSVVYRLVVSVNVTRGLENDALQAAALEFQTDTDIWEDGSRVSSASCTDYSSTSSCGFDGFESELASLISFEHCAGCSFPGIDLAHLCEGHSSQSAQCHGFKSHSGNTVTLRFGVQSFVGIYVASTNINGDASWHLFSIHCEHSVRKQSTQCRQCKSACVAARGAIQRFKQRFTALHADTEAFCENYRLDRAMITRMCRAELETLCISLWNSSPIHDDKRSYITNSNTYPNANIESGEREQNRIPTTRCAYSSVY